MCAGADRAGSSLRPDLCFGQIEGNDVKRQQRVEKKGLNVRLEDHRRRSTKHKTAERQKSSPPPFKTGSWFFGKEGDSRFLLTRRHMTCGQIHLLAYWQPQAAAGRGAPWLAVDSHHKARTVPDILTRLIPCSSQNPNKKGCQKFFVTSIPGLPWTGSLPVKKLISFNLRLP